MSEEQKSGCPFSGQGAPDGPPLTGHDFRWELQEHSHLLRPTADEPSEPSLEESAKAAWRNSVRCVGRRLWSALNVNDARGVSNPDELFEALLVHLRKATNGGKITPQMTVLREWQPEEPELRIWNHQVIRYAGYERPNGTFLGDPINIEFTKVAMSLGWKPPAEPSAFDLLPVIIQSGKELRSYDLPQSDVLEVRIRHPKYPALEAMNLKWHAVPIISDMVFATGSELYPCAPFNGHYLGTEIGARNLADSNRYNLLPEIAERLGFDTTDLRNLWKDHALIILNEAVLWSFDHDGVKIADHHRISEDFLKFCEQEGKEGRSVSAEWSWIVPPISGSATSVFHRLYEQKPIFPNFLLQVPAWQTSRGRELLAAKASGEISPAS